MGDDATPMTIPVPDGEVQMLATKMATAYREMVESYRRAMDITPQEADGKARELLGELRGDTALTGTPDQISWLEFDALARRDPQAALAAWQRLKGLAAEELGSGQRAADVFHWDGTPWERARFAVLRQSFLADLAPATGIERTLIDQLAQAQTMYLSWLEQLYTRTMSECSVENTKRTRDGKWDPPRLVFAEATEEAMAMVERWNRIFLRTLRALRDQRRYGLSVGSVGQLNIGMMQQNIAADDNRARDEPQVIDGTVVDGEAV